MNYKHIVRIKANYSFWKHPIQWIREIQHRKVMEALIEYNWNHGGREEFLEKMTEAIGSKGTN